MSWNVKYRMQYDDALGVQTTVDILMQNYVGSITYLDGVGEPVQLSYPEGDDRFSVIRGSELRLSFYTNSPYTFIPLFTSGKGKYKLEYYKGSALKWHGFIYPSVYRQTLGGSPQIIEISAFDGLGFLSNYTFSDNSNNPVFGEIRLLDVIRYCVVKTGLGMEISEGLDITHNQAPSRFLEFTKINTLAFVDGDKVMNCRDVLEKILKPLNARIFMHNGHFHVVRFSMYGNNFNINNYNATGNFTGTTTATAKTLTAPTVTGAGILALMAGGSLSVEQPVKEITINNDFNKQDGILRGDFSPIYWQTATQLRYWTLFNADIEQSLDGESMQFNDCYDTGVGGIQGFIYQQIEVSSAPIFNLIIKGQFYANGANITPVCLVKVRYYDGSTNKYLNSSGAWTSSNVSIPVNLEINQWQSFELKAERLIDSVGSGTKHLTVFVYQMQSSTTPSGTQYMIVKDFNVVDQNLLPIAKSVTEVIDADNENVENIDISVGVNNSRAIIKSLAPGVLLSVAGVPVTRLTRDGVNYDDTSDLLIADYSDFHSQPREEINGNIYGIINFNDTIKDNSNGKSYMVNMLTIADKSQINEVILTEVDSESIDLSGGGSGEISFNYSLPLTLT